MTLVVPPTLSVLVSVWMETLFYGANIIIYSLCLYVFTSRNARESNRTQQGLVIISTLLFASATAHVGVNVRRLIEGYVESPTKQAMTKYLLDITQPTDVAKEFLLVMVNLFSDLIITWRVHIVWACRWHVTAIPIVLCLSVFTCGLASAIEIAIAHPGQSIFLKRISNFATAFFSLTLVMNVTATFLIASRIWWVTRDVRALAHSTSTPPSPHISPSAFTPSHSASDPSNPSSSFLPPSSTAAPGSASNKGSRSYTLPPSNAIRTFKKYNKQYYRLIVLIVESAAFAAFALILELGFYAANFPGIYFIGDSVVQIVAMSPLIIIAFVGLSLGHNNDSSSWSNNISYSDSRTPGPRGGRRGGAGNARSRGRKPLSALRFQAFNDDPPENDTFMGTSSVVVSTIVNVKDESDGGMSKLTSPSPPVAAERDVVEQVELVSPGSAVEEGADISMCIMEKEVV
ncbi:hypothetical protein AX17_003833 [Amanita inopinata Kibby_2008]|nr:hypothetical protein AX17_003833 [Amanita inopinata Kibby_2008]